MKGRRAHRTGEQPSDGRSLVLVETDDPAIGWAAERVLQGGGYRVVACGGPPGLPGRRCPLVQGRACSYVSEAEAVIFALPLADPRCLEVLDAHRERATPVAVEAGLGDEDRTNLSDVVTIRRGFGREELLDTVQHLTTKS